MKNDNTISCLSQFIKLLNVPITRNSVQQELEKHPDHSSFLAISDVLNNWQIPNGSFRIAAKQLFTIPTPFIAHLSTNGGEFAIVNSTNENDVSILNEKGQQFRFAIEEFDKFYNGFVLIAEPNSEAIEHNYSQRIRKEVVENFRSTFIIISLITIVIILFIHSFPFGIHAWQAALLAFAKSAGLITTILLLIQSIDSSNPLIQRLCVGDRGANCDTILSSKAAKLTEEISWSEIGFFSFAGTWMVLFLMPASPGMLQFLAVINLISLPYTIYSIYYQYRVVKQWCILCCTVQTLLWLEFIAFSPLWMKSLHAPNFNEISIILLCMLFPVTLWIFIKPYLLKSQQLDPVKWQLKYFKYNTDIFQSALTQQPQYAPPDTTYSIVIGDSYAEKIITMVSNPYCPPCSKTHQILEEWLSKRSDIQLRIVFSTHDNQPEPKIVAQHLIALNKQDKALSIQAMRDWYGKELKDYKEWGNIYPVEESNIDNLSLKKQQEWCAMIDVKFTPTILINGYQLPRNYRVEDIKYLI